MSDPLVKLITKIIEEINPEEVRRISTITAFVVLIVKVVEKAHRKKKLSYDDSKRLVNLVIDTLIHSLKIGNMPIGLRRTIDFAENNREIIRELVDDSIHVWDALSRGCSCGGKKSSRIKKSVSP